MKEIYFIDFNKKYDNKMFDSEEEAILYVLEELYNNDFDLRAEINDFIKQKYIGYDYEDEPEDYEQSEYEDLRYEEVVSRRLLNE